MSTGRPSLPLVAPEGALTWPRVREVGTRVLFGDRTGLLIFLASLSLFGLAWRVSFQINDTYTLANGLYALEHGSMEMSTAAYGGHLDTPGAGAHDGSIYSRNYGALVPSLAILYALRFVDAVADLRVAVVAGWCLLVLATVLVAGRVLEREREARVAGAVGVSALFGVNLWLATPLSDPPMHLIALQLYHLVAAGFVGVFTYRLVTATGDRRRALLATALVALGTPLAFWASFPKRHVVTAAVAMAVAFALWKSRDGDEPYAAWIRGAAYGLVGCLAWVHAPEALILFVVLVVVDVPTAPSNSPRDLGVVAGVFLLSLLPLFVTNALISGNPVRPPRMLDSVGTAADVQLSSDPSSGGRAGGGWILGPLVAVLDVLLKPVRQLWDLLGDGAVALVRTPEEVWKTFVRSGYHDRVARNARDVAGANLSLLESAPVLAGLAGLVPAAVLAIRDGRPSIRPLDRARVVDCFVLLLACGYALIYLERLPIHAQITVRYLFPLYPLGVYGVVRVPAVGRALTDHWRTFAWAYAAAVLVGGQLLLVAVVALSLGRGEAFQFHAVVGLVTAGLLAGWSLTGRRDGWWGRAGAVTVALATASATVFVAFVALEYYTFGDSHALPVVRALADLVDLV